MKKMQKIFKRAWRIARLGVERFGGKVKEYFKEALKIAWAEHKIQLMTVKERAILVLNKMVEIANEPDNGNRYYPIVKDWENYGRKRTYISVGIAKRSGKTEKIEYGYIENNEYVKTRKYNDIFGGFNISGEKDARMEIFA